MLTNRAAGLDFGTTNSVVALVGPEQPTPFLLPLDPIGDREIFRSALCFWQDEDARGGLMVEAGPAAIRDYLDVRAAQARCLPVDCASWPANNELQQPH